MLNIWGADVVAVDIQDVRDQNKELLGESDLSFLYISPKRNNGIWSYMDSCLPHLKGVKHILFKSTNFSEKDEEGLAALFQNATQVVSLCYCKQRGKEGFGRYGAYANVRSSGAGTGDSRAEVIKAIGFT